MLKKKTIDSEKSIFNNLDLSYIGDYENARQHIDIHLVDQSKKETVDDAFAKQDCGLFTATYRIVLEDDEEGRYFIAVTKEILKGWDVTLEQMHEDALANQAVCIYEIKNEISDLEMDGATKNIKKVSEDQLKDIGLITNIQNSVTLPDAQKGDPFWQDGVGLYLQSMFEYEWLESKREGMHP